MSETLREILRIVYSSQRRMPAVYTSLGDRKKTFCIEFNDLSADDDYEMASEAHAATDMLPKELSAIHFNIIHKVGEDVMLGSFVATKLGHQDMVDEVVRIVIDNAIEDYHNEIQSNPELLQEPLTDSYIQHCAQFGITTAHK